MGRKHLIGMILVLSVTHTSTRATEKVIIAIDEIATARVQFAGKMLSALLQEEGFDVNVVQPSAIPKARPIIVIGNVQKSDLIRNLIGAGIIDIPVNESAKEGFVLISNKEITVIAGADDSGALYGSLELSELIKKRGKLPEKIQISDKPVFTLRGPCVGMQKTYLLPNKGIYNYPYTPELFGFFYDKQQWVEFLDLLVQNRMNTLYLWNGHPFSSLIKLKDYPEAVEVSDEIFDKNREAFRFLTTEADKRGICIIQMFYNIHLSETLAKKHGTETHLSEPTDLSADYTRKSIAEFVRSYPNVGLLVCLGEALSGAENKKYWLTNVIIPGVQDSMRSLGLREEPPIIIREHTMDKNAREIVGAGLEKYKNLYTMMKYNGEALTSYRPRGPWAEIHRELSSITSQHITNIHIMANLEPFRYGATRFIQKCVQAAQTIHHANGLHLYPLAYWAWPDSPDKAQIRQYERDWIWFEAWARYAWNPDRQVQDENYYWISRLAEVYGSKEAATHILEAYNHSGMCAPMILRRFGITNGNRQTLSLGMTLDQLVNPRKYRLWPRLVDSDGPVGERLREYVEKEWKGQEHVGETPIEVIDQVLSHSEKAVVEINRAADYVRKNREEFERLQNDILCIRAMSEFYAAKARAAMLVLRYEYSKDVTEMKKALAFLEKSLKYYRKLTNLTAETYVYANSLQMGIRKIPFTGSDGQYKHWAECIRVYEKELKDFQQEVENLIAVEAKN
ncbi:MAG: beta-N-acetylhexosaminidase family protein [Planctomycetota bacterium]